MLSARDRNLTVKHLLHTCLEVVAVPVVVVVVVVVASAAVTVVIAAGRVALDLHRLRILLCSLHCDLVRQAVGKNH